MLCIFNIGGYIMSEVKQELVMETTHGRKPKCKTEFKAVMNKVLVSGLILTTLLSSTIMPAMAADKNYIHLDSNVKITQEYGISVQESIVGIKNTINAINEMRKNGSVTDATIQSLANQLLSLESSVRISGDGVTQEVRDIIFEAEKAIQGLSNSSTAEVALSVVKASLGIDNYTSEESVTLSNAEAHQAITSFSDIGPNHWAYNDVMTIANKGIIAGTTAPVNGVGTYDPNGTVTLGQFLAIATRLVASDKIVEGNHAHWAGGNYIAAVESGLIKGTDFSGSSESLNAPISRQDMAYILVNVAKVNGEDLNYILGIENNISDLGDVSQSRLDAVKIAYSNGLLTGKGNNQFKPGDFLTRAEVAAVFCRVMNYTTRPTVTVQRPNQTTTSQGTVNYDSYLVTEAAETQGLIRPKYARQFDMQALDNLKVGEDATGVYIEFTAPTLPDELKNDFVFAFGGGFWRADGSNIGMLSLQAKSGEHIKVYVTDFEDNNVKKNIIATAQVSVSVKSVKLLNSVLSHTVYSNSKTQAKEAWYHNNNNSIVEYNSSHIFAGIGK